MGGVPVYLKAAAGALPGAARLPFVAGGGGPMPDLEVRADGVRAGLPQVTDYARVCGFRVRDELPATYPHVLAFPLHMRLMTDGSFPFSPVGLVHIENRIAVRRALAVGEPLDVRVRPGEHHADGVFTLVTEVRVEGELAWREESTMLRRGSGRGPRREHDDPETDFVAEWRLPGDLGRRYATVSGDRNPIHLHPLSARLFGFPRAIAHGMWTKARCLAALGPSLPDPYEISVEFRKPILLPGRVAFERRAQRFAVRCGEKVHLVGRFRD
jgi:MaoC like domain